MDKSTFTQIVIGFVAVVAVVITIGLMKNRIEISVTEKVMQRIRTEYMRDYVPGPYTPGFDPDKVNK
jgi:hypothetical protein